nr:MAG TPA: phospho-N-acetylmuramoyl-pentapeptide-transferase [Caudoviricetes sp.]
MVASPRIHEIGVKDMGDNPRVVRVTNQEELDAALAKPPSDDVVIQIDSDPGGYMPIYIFVMDSRGHAVEARGESRVVVSDEARVTARGHSQVEAHDDAWVYATDFSRVAWRDSSSGKCGYYARGQAWDMATVETHSLCPFYAFDSTEVTARGTARVCADGAASVTARDQSVVEMRDDVDVTAYDQSVVYCEGGEVYAHGHATVYVDKDACGPSVEGEVTVVVHDFKGGTPVMGGALVISA